MATTEQITATECKAVALRALQNARGDDHVRMRMSVSGMTAEQMDAQWGESGKSATQILAAYEKHVAEVDAAIAWLKAVPA